MRHYGFKRRTPRRAISRPRVQHTASEMSGTILTKILSLRYLCIPNANAGVAMDTPREGGDRNKEVNNGSVVGNITLNVSIRGISAEGTLEIGLVKIPRSHIVPVIGTDPIPASSEVDGSGLQTMMRENMPGWVYHYSLMSFAPEQPRNKWIKLNLSKFRASKWRDGDYLALFLFNRSSATITVDHTARYYEYK